MVSGDHWRNRALPLTPLPWPSFFFLFRISCGDMGTCTASQWPQDLHLPAQLGGLDPITPMMPAMLLPYQKKIETRNSHQ